MICSCVWAVVVKVFQSSVSVFSHISYIFKSTYFLQMRGVFILMFDIFKMI